MQPIQFTGRSEEECFHVNGYPMFIVIIVALLLMILFPLLTLAGVDGMIAWIDLPLLLIVFFACKGLRSIEPNSAIALNFCGQYSGSLKKSGFWYVNPFAIQIPISLKIINFETPAIQVNDKIGTPICFGIIVGYRIKDTYKSIYEVQGLGQFVANQADAVIRKIAHKYCYDNLDEHNHHEITLRSGHDQVTNDLEHDLGEQLARAGVEIVEVRINNLYYAPEIAASMLQRQHAIALISARSKISKGAVAIVNDTIDHFEKSGKYSLSTDQQHNLISNLLVILCGEKGPKTVVSQKRRGHQSKALQPIF